MHSAPRTTSTIAAALCFLVVTMVGCAQRGFPKEVVFDADRGSWSVTMDPDATEPPARVPVVTMYKWERVEGLLLVEGTPGYRMVMPGRLSSRTESATVLLLPYAVRQAWHGGWTLRWRRWKDTLVKSGDVLDHLGRPIGTSIPLWIEDNEGRVEMTIPSSSREGECGYGRPRWW